MQPVVTVVMYWLVFDKVFNTKAQMLVSGVEVPYVLYLTAGLVPWCYFSALKVGTNAQNSNPQPSYKTSKRLRTCILKRLKGVARERLELSTS